MNHATQQDTSRRGTESMAERAPRTFGESHERPVKAPSNHPTSPDIPRPIPNNPIPNEPMIGNHTSSQRQEPRGEPHRQQPKQPDQANPPGRPSRNPRETDEAE
ncbi:MULTISPECIES: hypothetical protein [Dyella]|uniref:Uncharacterized protein n=2 Tax=Dyella TaxID=231454 RepID=A0A4R0Z0D5_9GAMM|nr:MULTISPECIES: hypothetical protein [Dyella]TBR39844.1 hypothetical protein EYV96_06575 [Dyella terrae]TCI12576.1 hypothetical protein EZM97_04295 [Dyella soli]